MATEGITPDDFAKMLADALPNVGIVVDFESGLDLTLGGQSIHWSYPSVIVGLQRTRRVAVAPRFGDSMSLPGHLRKYLHGCRTQFPKLALYLGVQASAWPSVAPYCEIYGLGAVVVSLGTGIVTVKARPDGRRNIERAFERAVEQIVRTAKAKKDERAKFVVESREKFRMQAAQLDIGDLRAHFERFNNVLAELEARLTAIEARAEEIRSNESLDALKELERAARDLGDV